jgi:hypothetical protein
VWAKYSKREAWGDLVLEERRNSHRKGTVEGTRETDARKRNTQQTLTPTSQLGLCRRYSNANGNTLLTLLQRMATLRTLTPTFANTRGGSRSLERVCDEWDLARAGKV